MELRICCEQKIELEKYKNLKSINYEIDRYTFDNGELNGNVVVKGIYENNESLENEYIKSVPFTLMFKSSGYEIKELKIDNFKHYDVVNNGIECSFDIFVLYELKISEGSIPNIMSKDEVKEEKIEKEEIKEEKEVIVKKETNSNKGNKKEKKNNKKVWLIILGAVSFIIIIIYIANMNKVKVPYLIGITEENAILTIQGNNLIPNIEYEYNDSYEEGKVVNTYPYGGDKIDKGSTITVIISKGPSTVYSENSTIRWYNISNGEDNWKFTNPYITEDYLYIECQPTFATTFNWKGEGFGNASITDTFTKTVPVEIIYENKEVKANEEQKIKLKISTKDLDVNKPTTLYTRLAIDKNNKYQEIDVNFSISW